MEIETKITLDADIAKSRKELKDLIADIDIAKHEKNALDVVVERTKKHIDEKSEELKSIMNDIAQQKLDWLHEKDEQIKEIEDKKREIDTILARSNELDAKEQVINNKSEEIKRTRAENDSILLQIKSEKTDVEVKLREIEQKTMDIDKKSKEIDDKIVDFKQKVENLIKELLNI